jgi:hypothetical protein
VRQAGGGRLEDVVVIKGFKKIEADLTPAIDGSDGLSLEHSTGRHTPHAVRG